MKKTTSYEPPPPIHLREDDIEWVERVRRMVDGLQAHAEANSEGCEPEWLAVEYFCRAMNQTIDSIVKDFKERLGAKEVAE